MSPEQLAAAHRLGQDVCVVAGPGSGKTSVLIERFRWLVKERNVPAGRILAITFTDKAATEIKSRLVKAFIGELDLRSEIERAYVSTIHSFCTRLLRENAIAAGVDPEFQVLERSTSDRLLRQVTDEVLEEHYRTEPERMRLFLRSLAVMTERDGFVPDLAKSLMDIYSGLRVADRKPADLDLTPPDFSAQWNAFEALLNSILRESPPANTPSKVSGHAEVKEWALAVLTEPRASASVAMFSLLSRDKFNKTGLCSGSIPHTQRDELDAQAKTISSFLLLHYYQDERILIAQVLIAIDEQYRAAKRAVSGLDFDDLEEDAIRLLSGDDDLRNRVRESFEFILIDELQDTNPLQWKLLSLIRRPNNFFAVGDVNQSIFGFRYAEPALFHQYRRDLEQAGKQIDELRANYRSRAEILTAVNNTFQPAPIGIEAHTLQYNSDYLPKEGQRVESIVAVGDKTEETQRIEALWVAKHISDLVPPEHYNDIAILTRSNAATGDLQAALDEFGIPCIVLGGLTFYDTREVSDLVLLLEVLVNPRNEVALAGVLRSPLFGVTDEELLRLSMNLTLAEAVTGNPPAGWSSVEELRKVRDLISPDRLLRRIIDESAYEEGLTSRARANIEKLLNAVRSYYLGNPGPLSQTLEWIRSASPEAEAPPSDFGDAVRLMTIHKSKGLEFPIVFLPFLNAGRGTGMPVVTYSHQHGMGVKWRDPATRKGVGDARWLRNKTAVEQASTAEEMRLLYVGMTRAKEQLVVSYSKPKRTYSSAWRDLLTKSLNIDETLAHEQPPPIAKREGGATNELPTILRPLTPNQHDSSESATSISLFHLCPRKYYLGRYLRWQSNTSTFQEEEADFPEGDSGELDPSELGLQVHSILARQLVEQPAPEAVELADRFRVSALGKRAEKAQNKGYETDFVMTVDDLVVRGQIDLWFEHNRELILIDYKTDSGRTPQTAPYELQLQIYAMALEQLIGRSPDRAYLYFLKPNEPIEVNITPLHQSGAREAVRDFLTAQNNMDFPIRPGAHCYRCPHYKAMCPYNNGL